LVLLSLLVSLRMLIGVVPMPAPATAEQRRERLCAILDEFLDLVEKSSEEDEEAIV
jgi:hypothetical protein